MPNIKSFIEKRFALTCLLCLLIVGIKFYFSRTGFLNFEGQFFELARQISDGMTPLKEALYFKYQANPIGTSLFASLFIQVSSLTEAASKWPAILLIVPTFFVIERFFRKVAGLSAVQASIVSFALFMHPSVWTYTGKIFSDSYYVLFIFLIYSLYFTYRTSASRTAFVWLNILIFVGLFFKLNMAMIVSSIALDVISDHARKKQFNTLITDPRIVFGFSLLLALTSYFFVTKSLDVPFRQNNEMLMQLSPYEMIRNIILYNMHFFVVVAPVSLLSLYGLYKRSLTSERVSCFAFTCLASIAFFIFFRENTLFNTGELNFGSFIDDIFKRFYTFLAPLLIFGSLLYMSFSIAFLFRSFRLDDLSEQKKNEASLVLFFVAFLALHCFVKPVQRYLLVFIFFYFVHFMFIFRGSIGRATTILFAAIAGLYFAVSIFLSFQGKVRSDAYLELGKIVATSGLYQVDFQHDDLRANLFGNINEKFLLPNPTKPTLCVSHVGFADGSEELKSTNNIFHVQAVHGLTGKVFHLVARICSL